MLYPLNVRLTGVGAGVPKGVGVNVGPGVAVTVGVGVTVFVGVAVGGKPVAVGVAVDVFVGVAVGGNGVKVEVGVGVFVGVAVGGNGVKVEVGVEVFVGVGVGGGLNWNVIDVNTGELWLLAEVKESWNWAKRAGVPRAPPLMAAVHTPQLTPSLDVRVCTVSPVPVPTVAFQATVCQLDPTPASSAQLVYVPLATYGGVTCAWSTSRLAAPALDRYW